MAITPETAETLSERDVDVLIESGAGEGAWYSDSEYQEAGCRIVEERADVLAELDVLFQVRGLAADRDGWTRDLEHLQAGQTLVGLMHPYDAEDEIKQAAERNVRVLALDLLPRISRAQSMDALTSQSNIGGYMSVIQAANALPKLFPMMMTAAGTVKPVNVFVIGAGVAGLQAIATARRLGARVEAYDIRLEVKEQVESLGADFVELDLETKDAEGETGYAREMDETFYARQRERLTEVTSYTDVVITTANIPGRPAPELLSEEMVEQMNPGSVIVDLAAPNGGNCELTETGDTVQKHGVTISGPTNLPADVPKTASDLYARNMVSFLTEFTQDGEFTLDRDDEIIASSLLTAEGDVLNPHLDSEDQKETEE